MKILPSTIKPSEYVRTTFTIAVKHGQDFEEFKNPEAWAHISNELKIHDKVELLPEDGSFYAEGIVTGLTKTSVKVHFYLHVTLSGSEVKSKESPYEIGFAGKHKWRIVRKSDEEIIQHGFDSREAALEAAEKLLAQGE